MRICFIQFSKSFDQGNIAFYEYARSLKELGHKITFININEKKDTLTSTKVNSTEIFSFSYLKFLLRSIILARKTNSDIFHLANSPGMFLIKLFTRKSNAKWFLDIRSEPISGQKSRELFFKVFTNLNISFFNNCIFISKNLIPFHKQTVKNKQVEVVSLGVDYSRFSKTKESKELAKKFNIKPEDLVFIYIGSLAKPRTPDVMVKAFINYLNKKNKKPIKFLIIGKGSEKEELSSLIKKASLEKKIILTGYVDYKEIPNYLKLADVGLAFIPMTEKYDVQPPLKTVEYMAAKLLVVATATKGNQEFIKDKENGLLVKSDSKDLLKTIIFLNENRREIERISATAFLDARSHDWKQIVTKKLLPFYKRGTR